MSDWLSYYPGPDAAAFQAGVNAMAKRLGTKADWHYFVIKSESGMNPAAYNPNGGATGLIQFMPATAAGMGVTTAFLGSLSGSEQLEYVERYYKPYAGKMHSVADVYLVTFYPYAIGKSGDYVFGSERGDDYARLVASVNSVFDLDRDGYIHKSEFESWIDQKYASYGTGTASGAKVSAVFWFMVLAFLSCFMVIIFLF